MKKVLERGNGKRRVNRVGIYLTNFNFYKLNRLATACGTRPSTLACLIIEKALNNSELIKELQDENCIYKAYRIIPTKVHNSSELEFVLCENNERNDS